MKKKRKISRQFFALRLATIFLLFNFSVISQNATVREDSIIVASTAEFNTFLKKGDKKNAALSLQRTSEAWLNKKGYRTAAVNAEKALQLIKGESMTKTERDLHQLLYEIYKRAHYAPKQLFHLEQYLLLSDSLNISVREPVISFAREDSVKKATIDSLNKIQLTKLDEIRKKSLEDSRGQKNILRYFIAGALLLLVVFGFLLLRKKTAEPFPHQPSEKVNSNKVDLAGAREAAAFFNKAFSTEDQILDAGFTDYFIIHEPVETPGKAFYFAAEVKKLREGKMVFEKGQSASGTSNSLIFATGLYEKTSLSGSLRSMFTLFLLKEAVKEKKLISPAKIIDHVQNGFSKVDADAGENTHTLISLIDKEKLELSWAGNGALGCIIRNGTATDFNNIDSTSKTFALLPDDIVVCHANLHNLYATYVQKLVADNYGKPLTELKKIVTDFLENSGNEEIYLHDILIGAIKI